MLACSSVHRLWFQSSVLQNKQKEDIKRKYQSLEIYLAYHQSPFVSAQSGCQSIVEMLAKADLKHIAKPYPSKVQDWRRKEGDCMKKET